MEETNVDQSENNDVIRSDNKQKTKRPPKSKPVNATSKASISKMVHEVKCSLKRKNASSDNELDHNDQDGLHNMRFTEESQKCLTEVSNVISRNVLNLAVLLARRDARVCLSLGDLRNAIAILFEPDVNDDMDHRLLNVFHYAKEAQRRK